MESSAYAIIAGGQTLDFFFFFCFSHPLLTNRTRMHAAPTSDDPEHAHTQSKQFFFVDDDDDFFWFVNELS